MICVIIHGAFQKFVFAPAAVLPVPMLQLFRRLRRRKMKLLWLKKENRTIKGDVVKELLAMGMPTGLQFSITAIGSMVMQSANNGLGSTYVSAFTAAMKIKQFTMCPFDAIATSASVFCSQNLGAGQSDRIKKGLRCGITVGVGYGIAAGILLIFAGRTLSMLFVGKSAVAVLVLPTHS